VTDAPIGHSFIQMDASRTKTAKKRNTNHNFKKAILPALLMALPGSDAAGVRSGVSKNILQASAQIHQQKIHGSPFNKKYNGKSLCDKAPWMPGWNRISERQKS